MEKVKSAKLSELSWYRIGGEADMVYFPEGREALQDCVRETGASYTVLGGGTNVLISDFGIRGPVICTRKLQGLFFETTAERLVIEAEAGVSKAALTKVFLKHKLPPALFLSGIPGEVGGGVYMNAGVSEKITPQEFGEIVDWVEVVRPDATMERIHSDEMKWSYRCSRGWQPGIIYRVGMSWPLADADATIGRQVREATKSRLARQPLEYPSCGSVFVNPEKQKAGYLIEQCGLKGHKIGGAMISPKHANFIVNAGGAKASDVWGLIELARATVKEKFSVELSTEVKKLGEW